MLSPLLLLFFIDNIAGELEKVEKSIFADDIAIWAQHSNLKEAEKVVLIALRKLERWGKEWKLTISAAKSDSSFFSTKPHETKWVLNLSLSGCILKYNGNPKFLGVAYNRQLTFSAYTDIVCKKVKKRTVALRKLANTEWGNDKETLHATYVAVGKSSIQYATAAWLL